MTTIIILLWLSLELKNKHNKMVRNQIDTASGRTIDWLLGLSYMLICHQVSPIQYLDAHRKSIIQP